MNPNSNSLFHFTSKISVFKKILQHGLRYSFAFEAFPESIIYNVSFGGLLPSIKKENEGLEQGYAMPMISFCDIPLTRVNNHSKLYGKFAIGIEKGFLCHFYKDFINPVFYTDAPSIYKSIDCISKAHGFTLKYFLSQLKNSNDTEVQKVCTAMMENPAKAKEQLDLLPLELRELLDNIIDLKAATNTILSLLKPIFGVRSCLNFTEKTAKAECRLIVNQ